MLEMIFASNDFPEYYNNISKTIQVQNNEKKYRVEIVDEYVHQVNINDEPEWGYYIDLDTSTPPNMIYSKNKNNSPVLNLPPQKYINKQLNYLPTIEEEIFGTNNSKSYTTDKINTTSSVISGVTFCATVAFYYFYRSMRD